MAKQENHLPTLDGWRALAILLVLVDHSYGSFREAISGFLDVKVDEQVLITTGLLGVRIFFGISGYLITTRLLDEVRRHGRISLRNFYLRRLFRIFPAAWLFLSVMGILAALTLLPIGLGHWRAAILCFANYTYADRSWYLGHFWSLAVEEHFYLIWPSLLVLFGVRRGTTISAGLMFLVPLWRALDFRFHFIPAPNGLFWGRTDIYADYLAGGCLAALLLNHRRLRELAEQHLVGWRWLVIAAAVVVATYWSPHNWKITFALYSVTAFLIPPMLVGTVLHPESWFGRLLETRPMRLVGQLSYSLYLWQQAFLVWAPWNVPFLRIPQRFPLNILAAFATACLSHYLVEKPLIRLGRRVVARFPPAMVKSNCAEPTACETVGR